MDELQCYIILVYDTIDCLLYVRNNHDLFPLILIFFAQYNPSHILEPLFTPCSLKTIKQFIWIGLHESDMLLSQILFHILKDFSCMVVKETIF
jgi:hypothetical protein